MPYILDGRRPSIDAALEPLVEALKALGVIDGDINYTVTSLLALVFDIGEKPSYTKIMTIIGTLEAVKLEFYRRVAGPYEDEKIRANGDVEEYAHRRDDPL